MTYEEIIKSDDFEEIASAKHDNIKKLVLTEVEKMPVWARVANMYQITGLLAFVIAVFKAFLPFFKHYEPQNLWWIFYGLIFTFTVLIFLHELMHALAYLYVGVRKFSFGMNLRKFMFYVVADKQVVDAKSFKIVALAPVVIVGILSLAGMAIFYGQPAFYFFVPIFAFHSVFCGGDFGLLCFYANRPDKEIYTFDIKDEKKVFFYAKK